MGPPAFLQNPALSTFLEAAPDAIFILDASGAVVAVNACAERMFGYTHLELVGQPADRILRASPPGDDLGGPAMALGQQRWGRRKDGSTVPLEVSLSPLDVDGATFTIQIVRDTTARRAAETKFQGLLESAPDGIVVIDTTGRIVIVNTQAERLFGYGRDELVGQPIELLVPERYRERHVEQRHGYSAAPRTRPMGAGLPLTGRKKDGTEFPVEISLSPLQTEQGTLVTSIVRDITDRRRAEEQIRASLREKEVLLKEIHHRVKNNLQVTSSLLRLQSNYVEDPQARETFADSQNRIRSMALVHEKLYQSRDLSRIEFSEYARDLGSLLLRSFGVDRSRIAFRLEGSAVHLSIETAVPCGLILNELLSNCLKHAFPDGRRGQVTVTVLPEGEGGMSLSVRDDGVGLPADVQLERADTLGLRLVRTLADQLAARVEVAREGGTEFRLRLGEAPR